MSLGTPRAQEYWLPDCGLSQNIMLADVHNILGPSATVRPFTYQVCPTTYATVEIAKAFCAEP
jgi:hypothetical protein